MRAYETIRFTEWADVADILAEGRKSCAGRLPGRGGDFRPIARGRRKAATRRTLKRRDRARVAAAARRDEVAS
jgi:hypothetical protein